LQGVSYSTDDGTTFTNYADFYQNFQFLAIGAASADAIWAGGYSQDENNDGMWHYGNILISAEFSSDDTAYCASEDVIFTDNSYGSPESWSWDFGDGATPETATGIGPHTVTYSTSGFKNITLTIDKSTDQNVLVKTEFIHVSGSVPNDAGSITGEATVTAGETHTYSVVNQDYTIFDWDIPAQWTGSSTTNEIEIEFTGASNVGTITITPSNACGDGISSSLEITAGSSTGIEDFENDIMSIYPNPAKDFINITGVNNSDIYIYNSTGTLIKKVDKSDINSPINISELGAGIYHVSVVINENTYSKTICITK
jgi:PKD repeat protein